MNMIILNTNVVSEFMKPHPNPVVTEWSRSVPDSQLCITSITVSELLYGVSCLPEGRKRRDIATSVAYLLHEYASRTFTFDVLAAYEYGSIAGFRRNLGKPIGVQNAMVASIAKSRGYVVATRNIEDFEGTGVTVINPWGWEG